MRRYLGEAAKSFRETTLCRARLSLRPQECGGARKRRFLQVVIAAVWKSGSFKSCVFSSSAIIFRIWRFSSRNTGPNFGSCFVMAFPLSMISASLISLAFQGARDSLQADCRVRASCGFRAQRLSASRRAALYLHRTGARVPERSSRYPRRCRGEARPR